MKSALMGLILTMGLSAFANTTESVYAKDSALPTELKEQIIQYIAQQCPRDISAYGLSEITTQVTNQSELDVEIVTDYETVFSSRYYFDGMHPTTQEIKVLSSKRRNHTGAITFTIHQLTTQTGCQ